MVNGYRKTTSGNGKTVYQKRHSNGETTEVIIEEVPDSDSYFAHVSDPRGTVELGNFASKQQAKSTAKQWMRNHGKGVGGGGGGGSGNGLIPGTDADNDGSGLFGF